MLINYPFYLVLTRRTCTRPRAQDKARLKVLRVLSLLVSPALLTRWL